MNKEKKKTIQELREELERRELEAKIKEGRIKQTKDIDTSIIGVCLTCQFPIHHGEAKYTPYDTLNESEYSGLIYGGGASGLGLAGAVKYQGSSRSHGVGEQWVQCGFCYNLYEKDFNKFKNWGHKLERRSLPWRIIGTLIGGMIGLGVGIHFNTGFWAIIFVFMGAGGGASLAFYSLLLFSHPVPKPANRYKLRIKERKEHELEEINAILKTKKKK